MECTRCQHNGKQSGEWTDSPCSRCQLKEDSLSTLPYLEERADNAVLDPDPEDEAWEHETADSQTPQPYEGLEGDESDPLVPLSALAEAMSLWLSLSLPARRVIQLRMRNLPYSAIGRRLGCTRQAAEKLVAQAIAKEPLLQNLLPAKSAREATPLSATRKPAIAEDMRNAPGKSK